VGGLARLTLDEEIRLRDKVSLILWEGVIASDWVKGELTRAVFVASPGMSSCFWFGLGHPRWYRGRFFSRVRLQRPHDQIGDQIADRHAAERSFDDELRDHILCERQFGRSFLAPVPHADCEACHVRGFRWLMAAWAPA
jgi:hypothetical protein